MKQIDTAHVVGVGEFFLALLLTALVIKSKAHKRKCNQAPTPNLNMRIPVCSGQVAS